jgi:hypothetical protein
MTYLTVVCDACSLFQIKSIELTGRRVFVDDDGQEEAQLETPWLIRFVILYGRETLEVKAECQEPAVMGFFDELIQAASLRWLQPGTTSAGMTGAAPDALTTPTSGVTIVAQSVNIGGDVAGRDITKEPPSRQHISWEEVPQSTAALQATDTPNVSIEFSLYYGSVFEGEDFVGLRVIVTNEGPQVVNRFRVELVLTNIWWDTDDKGYFDTELVEYAKREDRALQSRFGTGRGNNPNLTIIYQPDEVLFPGQPTENIGAKIGLGYPSDTDEQMEWHEFAKSRRWSIEWKLYADNMPYRHGTVQVCDLPVRQY